MQTATRPHRFSVCLTRQQLTAVRTALRWWRKDISKPEIADGYIALVDSALERVHDILVLDAGGAGGADESLTLLDPQE